MKSKYRRLKEKANNYMFDHYIIKRVLHELHGGFFAVLAGLIFAFGFCSFISPSNPGAEGIEGFKIVTGGVSGLSQNVAKIFEMCGVELADTTIEGIGYAAFNVPLMIFAFFMIGKRFSIHTIINVVVSSVLIVFLPQTDFVKTIVNSPLIKEQVIARTIFAALCTGISSALAFKGELSCGGIDIVTYYFSLRKSTSVGKYGILINGIIISTYSLLLIISNPNNLSVPVLSLFYSVIYLLVVNFIIDFINLRNKKVQVEIITQREDLPKILLTMFPHGATVVKGTGAYSHQEKTILYMIVSSYEYKKVVAFARKADPHAFVSVTSLVQVFGNFFIKPIS